MAKYIDCEVAQKKIEELCKDYGVSYGKHHGGFAEHISEITKQVPVADVAEVKHGKWNQSLLSVEDGFWTCSGCGFVGAATAAWKLYKYCPNCGAKMDL